MKKEKILVKDIMIKDVIAVFPETTLLKASAIMTKNGYNGLPVVNKDQKVIGIITEYDLLTKGTAIHLPTFIKLFGGFPEEKDLLIKEKLGDILNFTVRDVMNDDPLVVKEKADLVEIVAAFSAHHRVNPIPVVNEEGSLVGIVSRFDVIKLYAKMLSKLNRGYKK